MEYPSWYGYGVGGKAGGPGSTGEELNSPPIQFAGATGTLLGAARIRSMILLAQDSASARSWDWACIRIAEVNNPITARMATASKPTESMTSARVKAPRARPLEQFRIGLVPQPGGNDHGSKYGAGEWVVQHFFVVDQGRATAQEHISSVQPHTTVSVYIPFRRI